MKTTNENVRKTRVDTPLYVNMNMLIRPINKLGAVCGVFVDRRLYFCSGQEIEHDTDHIMLLFKMLKLIVTAYVHGHAASQSYAIVS